MGVCTKNAVSGLKIKRKSVFIITMKVYLFKKTKMTNLTAIYTKETEGWYTVEILELPGCVSCGKTMEEAQKMIKEAAIGYLEAQKKAWTSIGIHKETFISPIQVAYETV